MHTSTFLQKATFSWLSWQSFLILLTLFASVTAPSTALAQTTINFRRVFVATGTGSSTVTSKTYNTNVASSNGSNGAFDGTNLGSFDRSASQLLLQGGEIEIVEDPNETYPTAVINYGVKQGTLTSSGASNIPALSGTLPLTQVSYDVATRTRRFALDNQGIDILALATTNDPSNPVSYRFDISVSTGNGQNTDGDVIAPILGMRRKSVFTAIGAPPVKPTITPTTVFIAPNAGANVTYNVIPSTPRPFNGGDLSSADNSGNAYDVNAGQLLINGGAVTTIEGNPNTVNSVILYYRVRSSSAVAAYQPITLTQISNNNGTRTFSLTTAQLNVISSSPVVQAGTYNLDVYFQANITNNSSGAISSITSPDNPNSPYSATFIVSGTVTAQTIWLGGTNDNWFDASNWSNGVPTKDTNVLVRDLGAGTSIPYPNIYSDAQATTPAGVVLYDNAGSGPAIARDLVMGGASSASHSIVRLSSGRLKVFGNLDNTYDSFTQRENTTIEFAGGNQNITNGSFVAIDISGGGVKYGIGIVNVSQSINFISGILSTDTSHPSTSIVVLNDLSPTNTNIGAQLLNETDQNYLRGLSRVTNAGVRTGERRTYGNMGMTITFRGTNSPGGVTITRNTAEYYNPMGDRYSIRRIFNVVPTDQATSTGGLTADMEFRYQDIETKGLGTSGDVNIPENNLSLFESSNSGGSFVQFGKDLLDTDNNILIKYNVTAFGVLTLGDLANPLPVVLTAFTAARANANAILTWQTASEQHNKGFEVQVATDGVTYRTLAFVESHASNSVQARDYQYLDTESGKAGVRYYRLHQIDFDGTDSYSPIRTVNFTSDEIVASTLVASPNPFTNSLAFSFNGTTPSDGSALVTLIDMAGRTVHEQRIALSSASMSLSSLDGLRAGLYVARITLPDGSAKTVRIQKQ
jgi:hypothetical protein